MNEDHRHDDDFLAQVDRLLEQGRPHDEGFINTLAHTIPKADHAVQHELEQTLLARLQKQQSAKIEEKLIMHISSMTRPARPVSIAPLTWAVTLATVAAALMMIILVNLNQGWMPLATQTPAAIAQSEQPVSLVIATQDIQAGTVITDAMVGIVTLSQSDLEELGIPQPGQAFLMDAQSVIGQTAAIDIDWFRPIKTDVLGEPFHSCDSANAICSELPDDYATIGFPTQADTLQGLEIGDRVDVIAVVDGELQVIAANMLLSAVQDDIVTLASPSWQIGVLMGLSQSGDAYALRLHTGDAPEAADKTPIEYLLTAPEVLPQDYLFDLIVNVPAEQGYLLTGLPASIDHLTFTSNGDTLHFWFKDLKRVSIADGTAVTIRLPRDDAANLDYLLGLDMELTFVPDEDAASQP
jgi:hypothetical protein